MKVVSQGPYVRPENGLVSHRSKFYFVCHLHCLRDFLFVLSPRHPEATSHLTQLNEAMQHPDLSNGCLWFTLVLQTIWGNCPDRMSSSCPATARQVASKSSYTISSKPGRPSKACLNAAVAVTMGSFWLSTAAFSSKSFSAVWVTTFKICRKQKDQKCCLCLWSSGSMGLDPQWGMAILGDISAPQLIYGPWHSMCLTSWIGNNAMCLAHITRVHNQVWYSL